MSFTGPAARWLQSIEHSLHQVTWHEFGLLIRERFGKNQHETFLRQLLHIRQYSSVSDYIEQFAQLVDQLKAYQPHADPLYYITKFVDGLRDDVCSIVLVQRPRNLDTAYVLAQLQEEVREGTRQREGKFTPRTFSKPAASGTNLTHDSKATHSLKLDHAPAAIPSRQAQSEDKLATLYAYRKAKGLCYKCGLQYNRGHKCPDTVQLHLVEEMWQSFQLPEDEEPVTDVTAEELLLLHMSQAAVLSADTPKTMRFIGHIGGMDMLVLLDSGSSTSFIGHRVASQLPNWTPLPASLRVQVANGSQLPCDHELTNVTWYLNEYAFSSSLKIIQLTHYDLILGMDWLSSHNPMWVHWEDKWLIIPYQGSTIKLCGMGVQDMQCTVMEVSSLESLTDKDQACRGP
jgi:hypothetical protein